MKILITGHLGFVGSNLKPYLERKGHEIIGLDRLEFGDILSCALPDCDLVIHLAAETGVRESVKRPHDFWRVNVDGTRRILQHYHDKRVLVASSSSQYEPHLNPYAASKHVMEKIPNDNVCWMRFHTVYGPNQRKGMLFDKLKNDTVTYVTDHERDFIHVKDVCRAIEILIDEDLTGPVDIGTGHTVKISDLRPDLPILTDTPYERKRTCANMYIMEALGFKPRLFLLPLRHDD